MSSVIVAFSGAIGSGKSSLSQAVANGLEWSRVSFGEYVRQVASQRGCALTRESLQEVGASLIEAGWDDFCSGVLSQAAWEAGQCLVVDGVRHIEALQTLKRITAPSKVLLVFIHVSESERKSRLEATGSFKAPLDQWASHSTEVQVCTILPDVADLIMDGSIPINEGVRKVEEWVRSLIDDSLVMATNCVNK